MADFLAQLDDEDLEKMQNNLAQISVETTQTMELMQTFAEEDDEMLIKTAKFLSQLSADEVSQMDNYLIQIEQADADDSSLAQVSADLD